LLLLLTAVAANDDDTEDEKDSGNSPTDHCDDEHFLVCKNNKHKSKATRGRHCNTVTI